MQYPNDQLVREIDEHKQVAAALQRHLEELTVLQQVTRILVRATDLPAALQDISENVAALVGACCLHVIILSNRGTERPILVGFEQGRGRVNLDPVAVA